MTEYNPYEFAKSLGFTEAEATTLGNANADATNIRAVARAKGLLPEAPLKPKPSETKPAEGQGFGDYLCPKCKVTHRAGSKVHQSHLKLL